MSARPQIIDTPEIRSRRGRSSRRKGANGELWKPVTISDGKYRDRYEVSNHGRVRASGVGIGGMKPGRILFQGKDARGYPQVIFYFHQKAHTVKVHRLVAAAFLGDRLAGMTVNHINGDKADNHVENLEYVTNKENCWHAHRVIESRSSITIFGERMSLAEAVERYAVPGVHYHMANRRILRLNWSVEDALFTEPQPTGRPSGNQISKREAVKAARAGR